MQTCILQLKSEYHANDSLRAYVYVLCLLSHELYISGRIKLIYPRLNCIPLQILQKHLFLPQHGWSSKMAFNTLGVKQHQNCRPLQQFTTFRTVYYILQNITSHVVQK